MGNSVLPQYVKNSLCVLCTELAVYFLISCEILVVRSPAKFAYFLKSKRNYLFATANLSSGNALKIQGQYEHCFQYRARDRTLPGSIKLGEFEWKDVKRPQKEGKTRIYDFFLRSFANFAFLCILFGKRDTRSILDKTQSFSVTFRTSEFPSTTSTSSNYTNIYTGKL